MKGKRTVIGVILLCACGYLITIAGSLYAFSIVPEGIFIGIISGLSGVALIALGLIAYGLYTRLSHAFYMDEEGNQGKGDIRRPRIGPGSMNN